EHRPDHRFVRAGHSPGQRHRGVRDLHQGQSGTDLEGHHRSGAARQVQLRRPDALGLDDRFLVPRRRARHGRHRRGREPGRRAALSARAVVHGDVERQREGPGLHSGDVGDRAGRRLLSAHRGARPAPRGRERRAVRRLADDPLGSQDAAGDRGAAHHPRLADVRPGL
ncbi:MAG: Transcriptional regulator, ArsR family / Ligand-binding SRPBCC domain protein family, partial [uncultured Nocardioidaceae bacterium]